MRRHDAQPQCSSAAVRLLFVGLLASLFSSPTLWAGGSRATGAVTDQLMVMNGAGVNVNIGGFVTSNRGPDAMTVGGVPIGLNTRYNYFLEVGPAVPRLVVQLFDPDIVAGGANAERIGDRDLARNALNSVVTYRLFDPSGTQVATRFGAGSHLYPGSDNAWATFYDSNTATITGGTLQSDNFNIQAYNNNSASWASDWIESNEQGTVGPTGGQLSITSPGGELQITNLGATTTNRPGIERQIDLTTPGYVAAVLSFDWRVTAGVDPEDSLFVEASANGGATWTPLDVFRNIVPSASGSRSYDLTPYIAASTRIRFRVDNLYGGANEFFLVDNLQIRGQTLANGGTPARGHWRVTVNMSSAVNDAAGEQNELNAYGLRAHDGNSGAGGAEVPVYSLSYMSFGLNANRRTRAYQVYPYVTEGCSLRVNDFDFDSEAPDPDGVGGINAPYGSWDLTSRSGSFTADEGGVLSVNNYWHSKTVNGWTSGNSADDYGIWDLDLTVADFGPGNYALVYLGNGNAANPDANANGTPGPTASPEANTFRLYFSTDANTAPAKPYFSQRVAYASSGPNPPVMGMTTRFAVTLRITNPVGSLGSITFDGSRLISARVPGDTANARVRYGGVAPGFPSVGSLTGQPAIGSPTAGDVLWNPGTVAPGSSETLVYFLDVQPLVATDPLVVPVTGTYGSNGSRAQFIDETGAATASFTFGNLCGLQVIAGASASATAVLVSSLRGYETRGGTLLEWQTAAEAGTVQFELWRLDRAGQPVKVSEEPVLAVLDAPQGGTYHLLDEDADPGQPHTYELVEVDAQGRRLRHGPFTVQAEGMPPWLAMSFDSAPHPPSERYQQAQERARNASPGAGEQRRRATETVKIVTGETGFYRVQALDLAPLLGYGLRSTMAVIQGYELELSHEGRPIAWMAGPEGSFLEFYAPKIESVYTDDNVYLLRFGQGRKILPMGGSESAVPSDIGSFRDTVRFEENLRPLVLVPLDPESDIWFWDFVRSGHPQQGHRSFPLQVPAVAPGQGEAELRIDLQGAQIGEHTLEVMLNGAVVGDVQVSNLERTRQVLTFDHDLLLSGANTVELVGTSGGLVFVDGFELVYDRLHQALDDRLRLHSEDRAAITVRGFTDADIRVFDLSDAEAPRQVKKVSIERDPEEGFRATFVTQSATRSYLMVGANGFLDAKKLQVDRPSTLHSSDHTVDYLVITTAELESAARDLARYRQSRGLKTLVVDVEDIYDEFSGGLREPPALRDFLTYTATRWRRAPRYVVLAGAGTYDYKDHLGFGNALPTRLRSNGSTLFATDQPYVDLVGDDGVPEMILGRIPALTTDELSAYVDKLIAYEALDEPAAGSEVAFVSDNGDAIADFPAVNRELAALLPTKYSTSEVALPDFTTLTEARSALFEAFGRGPLLLNYLGHGGVDRMAAEGLLTIPDVPQLPHGERLPVVVAVSCYIGLHGLPGFDSLGEHLVLRPDGGAIAVWAPSWLSHHQQARHLGDRLLRSIFQSGETILGEAVLRALEAGAALGLDRHQLETYQLLGDPALEMRLVP